MRIWSRILAEIEAGRPALLISVLATEGSAPREAGARILLTNQGFYGTIGGGALEWRALADGRARLDGRRRDFGLLDLALGPDTGQCCGGRVTLGFELFDREDLEIAKELASAEAAGPFRSMARLERGRWRREVVPGAPGQPYCRFDPDGLAETFGVVARRLFLFGAGHVGRALALALAPLPLAVTWVDERAEAFPAAHPATVSTVATVDPVSVLDQAVAGDFVLVMTHSHPLDLALVDRALRIGGLPYVGVIGSKTKRARFRSRLLAMGHHQADIDRMVCPIGALGPTSRLPAVIAAATAVELIIADEKAAGIGYEPSRTHPDPSPEAADDRTHSAA